MSLDILKKIIEDAIPYATLGSFGGVIAQLNSVRKGNPFKITLFICNIVIGMGIGYMIGISLPETLGDTRFALSTASGVFSYPLLDFMEQKGLDLIIKKITGQIKN